MKPKVLFFFRQSNAQKAAFFRLCVVLLLVAVSSCSTSRKAVSRAQVSRSDSVAVSMTEQGRVVERVFQTDTLCRKAEQSETTESSETFENSETIAETITTTTDTLGCTVRTEQRTITRRTSTAATTHADRMATTTERAATTMERRLDSLRTLVAQQCAVQTFDSMAYQQTKQPAVTASPWQRLTSRVGEFAFIALLLILFAYLMRKFIISKLKL